MINRYKKNDETSYTLGTTLTIELLRKRIEQVRMVYLHSKTVKNETIEMVIRLCENNKIPIVENDKVFTKLSEKENCFVIGVFDKYESNLDFSNSQLVLVNPSNSGNLGTIIRSMVGFGVFDLAIIRPGSDVFDPKTIRASMGALFRVRFRYFTSMAEYLDSISDRNVYPFMLEAQTILGTDQYPGRFSLVFGNEATGLDPSFLGIGIPLRIAHLDTIDSLNLTSAVSIALYEFTKAYHQADRKSQ